MINKLAAKSITKEFNNAKNRLKMLALSTNKSLIKLIMNTIKNSSNIPLYNATDNFIYFAQSGKLLKDKWLVFKSTQTFKKDSAAFIMVVVRSFKFVIYIIYYLF